MAGSRWRSVRRSAAVLSARLTLAVDTGIAALCYLAMVAPVTGTAGWAGWSGWSLFGFAALASVPLVWRRQHPVPVAALVGVGTLGLCVTGRVSEFVRVFRS